MVDITYFPTAPLIFALFFFLRLQICYLPRSRDTSQRSRTWVQKIRPLLFRMELKSNITRCYPFLPFVLPCVPSFFLSVIITFITTAHFLLSLSHYLVLSYLPSFLSSLFFSLLHTLYTYLHCVRHTNQVFVLISSQSSYCFSTNVPE